MELKDTDNHNSKIHSINTTSSKTNSSACIHYYPLPTINTVEREEAADLNTINDEEILDSLFRKAVRIDSIESFETLLEKVQKGY